MRQEMLALLKERGVDVRDIARIVLRLQKPFSPELTLEECLEAVHSVLRKREVQYALLTGLALDKLAEQGLLPEPLQTIVAGDEPLYGIDENLAMAIASIYGTVGITSFGYLDKKKMGIIGRLDKSKLNRVNTFLDDLVAGIAAAASARIAHHYCKTP
ncbi:MULTISPECIES: phosphatidylglycerophosphatase A [unclassified Carboxydocella]|uniref:phosphatidylglycerophosphatase A family protein n=1 Tax=unclassified Carboxydocella TaxID=2685367 RepID=UPI0009ADA239|nr:MULTISPECIES: phosphatidylglycerophosphatase A [unclassified Carboxydocella]GAW28699.1 phosphatidylglycerophosphatase A [Carboxydocella sp. ULO1]GAW30544.1 phosphatidylglycerophosphatase A [Carboxydocella sp. JDF658]